MKIKKLLCLSCGLLLIISTLSACKSNITYVANTEEQDLTIDEQLIEYLPFKESVLKQLSNKIKNFDKMKEMDTTILNNSTKEWELEFKIPAKEFNYHKDRFFQITAQKNNILTNNYEEILNEIAIEEEIYDDVYSTVLGDNNHLFYNDSHGTSTYYKLIIDGKTNPSVEDFKDKNQKFYLYINLGGEETRKYSACTDSYFEEIEKDIKSLLERDYFKDMKNITVTVLISGCGEIKYSLVNGIPVTKITRSIDGLTKLQKIEDAGKTELELMTPEERKKFIEEHQSDIDKAVQERLESIEKQALKE